MRLPLSHSLTATETCGPKISQRILVGFETSDITPGCSVQAGSVTFVSGFSPMVSVNHVLTFLLKSFFKISNDTEVVDAVEQALQSFEDVDYNALLKGGRKLASLPPVKQLSSFMWIIWVVVGVIILVVIAVVFFVWHFRRQLFSLSSQVARQRVMRWRVSTVSANVMRGFTNIPILMPFEINI